MYILHGIWADQGLDPHLLSQTFIPRSLQVLPLGDVDLHRHDHRVHDCAVNRPDRRMPAHISLLGSSRHYKDTTRIRVTLLR